MLLHYFSTALFFKSYLVIFQSRRTPVSSQFADRVNHSGVVNHGRCYSLAGTNWISRIPCQCVSPQALFTPHLPQSLTKQVCHNAILITLTVCTVLRFLHLPHKCQVHIFMLPFIWQSHSALQEAEMHESDLRSTSFHSTKSN